MAPSLIVMVREAVVVSATHGGLYLLIHCNIAHWAHSGGVFWLNKNTQYTNWTKNPDFAHCALWCRHWRWRTAPHRAAVCRGLVTSGDTAGDTT